MTCSPSGVSRIASAVGFASAPGAPFGQSLIDVGCANTDATDRQINRDEKQCLTLMALLTLTSHRLASCQSDRLDVSADQKPSTHDRDQIPSRGCITD